MEAKETRYVEVNITPAASGFGLWDAGDSNGEKWDDADELLDEIRQTPGIDEVYELGVDELPEGVENIRGKINNQPGRVFACKLIRQKGSSPDDDLIRYFGIDEIQVDSE